MLNSVKWANFKLSNLFEISKLPNTNSNVAESLFSSTSRNDIAYITRTTENNGVRLFCNRDLVNRSNISISPGNKVIIGGEATESFFIESDFITGNNITILGHSELDRFTGLFIVTVLDTEFYRYSYGRGYSMTRVKDTIIKLPIDVEGKPNWTFMRDYIKNLSNNNLDNFYETKKNININLKDRNWDYFKLEDLFSIKRGKRHISANREKGDIPYVSASDKNNGVTDFISNPLFLENKGLVLTTFGDVYYHDNVFTASDEINILKNKNLNVYIGLFISTLLKKEEFRYSFGRKLYYNKIKTKVIKLPVDKEGNPDWQFMEDYIKSLPYTKHL